MINSPRSLEACSLVGVEPSELYKLTLEQYKSKHPEVIGLTDKIIQYRYDAQEKFRNETIEQVKSMRKNIIEAKEKQKEKEEGKTNRDGNETKTNMDEVDKKWEKI